MLRRKKAQVDARLSLLVDGRRPETLYGPMRYVLTSGGKRLRAVLVLLACEAAGGASQGALHAAVAVEILHNFTLVHDDVMDHAPMRRNRPTVHTKWDESTAILAGDELLAYGYKSLLRTRSARLPRVLDLFTDAFIGVCEGQGFDKEFEGRSDVTPREYLSMIDRKTGRVITAALMIGGHLGGGTPREVAALAAYGRNLGRAFQIQDDLLDVAGTERSFGKRIGGDIVEGKKTYLLLEAIRRSAGADRRLLRTLTPANGAARVAAVRRVYERTGAIDAAASAVGRYSRGSLDALAPLKPTRARAMLAWLAAELVGRQA